LFCALYSDRGSHFSSLRKPVSAWISIV
jgi:hypothetical protein